jgi:hypothetical protein
MAPTRADHKWQAQEKQGFDASSFRIDWEKHRAFCPAGKESLSWTPAVDRCDNQVIKIKFSMRVLQALLSEGALYDGSAPHHFCPHPRAPSSLTGSQGTRKRSGILENLWRSVWHRRNDLARGPSLWHASQSLPGHAENASPAFDHCDGYQPGAYRCLVGWRTSGSHSHLGLRRFSSVS